MNLELQLAMLEIEIPAMFLFHGNELNVERWTKMPNLLFPDYGYDSPMRMVERGKTRRVLDEMQKFECKDCGEPI